MRRAGDVAKAAEDDDGKCLQRGEIAHRRRDEEDRTEQGARRGGKARADGEGGGVDALDVHSHQRRSVAILEGRAHGLAELGAVDQHVGGGDQDQRHDEHEQRAARRRRSVRSCSGSSGNGVMTAFDTPPQ